MKNFFIFRLFILFVTLSSCSKEDAPLSSQVILNSSYGADGSQIMDIYLPPGRSTASTKSLIIIHGGSWTTGDKADLDPFVDTLRRRMPEYAIFNINYRLSANPLNLFPTQEMDVKAAVEHIHNHRSNYAVSGRFVLMGASAGAHLAMLQAYKYNSPVKASAVVSFFGPGDLTELYNNPVGGNTILSSVLAYVIGKTPSEDPLLYRNSSPLTFISSASAMPTILLHGGLDPLVSPGQSEAVRDKLSTAGISNQYVFYPDGGHGDWDNLTYYDAFNNIQAFINVHVP